MKRRTVVASTTIAAVILSGVIVPQASARTPSWLKVRTPSRTTAYNGGKATVKPKAAATGQRTITSLRLTAYRGSKRVTSGKSVRLAPGRYRTVTSGTYRAYRFVNRTRTRTVLHEANIANATCRVTSAGDAGFGDGTTHSFARCTNRNYPRQPQTSEKYERYQAGDTYVESFYFDDEYVTQRYVARVRSYGSTHRFSSSKRRLTVRDGGYRKVFTGSGSHDTGNFKTPRADWTLRYSYSCSDRDNFIIWVRRPNGDYVDLAANELDYSGSGTARLHGGGRVYLEITTYDECNWRISIK